MFIICYFYMYIFRNKDLPWALPPEQIYKNIYLCLKSQKKIISTVSEEVKRKSGSSKSSSIEMKILLCSLDMISSCVR